jgi:hypothetical protein
VAQSFFYLLDVGTSNALVLYNESVKIRLQPPAQHTPMNIVQFKMKLVEDLVGSWKKHQQPIQKWGRRRRAAHPSPHQKWGTVAV